MKDEELDKIEEQLDEILARHNPMEEDSHNYYWHHDAGLAMQEYFDQQLSEYKRKLKEEIEKQLVPFTSVTINDAIRNDYRREVIKLIDTIQP